MTEEKDLLRLHIVLDASKVKRCDWCGSPQSSRWLSHEEGTFCSYECIKAASSSNHWMTASMTMCSATFFGLVWIWLFVVRVPFPPVFYTILIGLTIFFVGLFSVRTIIEFSNHRFAREIPKGSRRNVGTSQVSLLRSISSAIECPNCDAPIDVKTIGDDMTYHCHYCGASGVIEIKMLK